MNVNETRDTSPTLFCDADKQCLQQPKKNKKNII